jgi:putative PIN family toxin of toxin-antitoxin system
MQPALTPSGEAVVLDTNIVLDLFVFNDPATLALKTAVLEKKLRWLASSAMRSELQRVLTYPLIAKRMALNNVQPADVLQAFDTHALVLADAAKAPVTCSDPDDQIFIDLALAHQAWLISKDQAVLSMKKRLLALGVKVQASYNPG